MWITLYIIFVLYIRDFSIFKHFIVGANENFMHTKIRATCLYCKDPNGAHCKSDHRF